MHKKLAADLTSLAHSILQIKNKEDVLVLKEKAHQVYEKLAVLAYVEEYLENTPNATETKEELIEKLVIASEVETSIETVIEPEKEVVVPVVDKIDEVVAENGIEEITEQPFDELEETIFGDSNEKNDVRDVANLQQTLTLEEELEDTISLDVAANLFEKVVPKKSLNDQLQQNINIDLNDRIAFVKHLFDGDQGDFNRVISQLNSIKTAKEAKKFINKMVKPDYNWSEKEAFEARFMSLVARKFL